MFNRGSRFNNFRFNIAIYFERVGQVDLYLEVESSSSNNSQLLTESSYDVSIEGIVVGRDLTVEKVVGIKTESERNVGIVLETSEEAGILEETDIRQVDIIEEYDLEGLIIKEEAVKDVDIVKEIINTIEVIEEVNQGNVDILIVNGRDVNIDEEVLFEKEINTEEGRKIVVVKETDKEVQYELVS